MKGKHGREGSKTGRGSVNVSNGNGATAVAASAAPQAATPVFTSAAATALFSASASASASAALASTAALKPVSDVVASSEPSTSCRALRSQRRQRSTDAIAARRLLPPKRSKRAIPEGDKTCAAYVVCCLLLGVWLLSCTKRVSSRVPPFACVSQAVSLCSCDTVCLEARHCLVLC